MQPIWLPEPALNRLIFPKGVRAKSDRNFYSYERWNYKLATMIDEPKEIVLFTSSTSSTSSSLKRFQFYICNQKYR